MRNFLLILGFVCYGFTARAMDINKAIANYDPVGAYERNRQIEIQNDYMEQQLMMKKQLMLKRMQEMEQEKARNRFYLVDDVLSKSERFLINGQIFEAISPCSKVYKGDKVVFVEGDPNGNCALAKFIDAKTKEHCEVFCPQEEAK